MSFIIILRDSKHKANDIRFEIELVSEAMNKMLMMYCKELWGPHWLSLLMREQRGTAWQEGDQKFMGGCGKKWHTLCWQVFPLSFKIVNEKLSWFLSPSAVLNSGWN